jgi:hypothetical protein
MRYVLLVMTVGASLQGQAIMDATAAAAGGIAGGAAGKKVNDGLNKVLGNVATQTAKAAGDAKPKAVAVVQAPTVPVLAAAPAAPAPFLELSPGVPKSGGVPLPPAAPHKLAMERPAPLPVPPPVVVPEPLPPPPPPPEATVDDLKNLAAGTNRDDLLKLGAPSSRITMFDDGHLRETYHYYSHGPNGDASIGVVRLVDGAVSVVEMK